MDWLTFEGINWLAVAVAFVVSFAFGWWYYSSAGVWKVWKRAANVTDEAVENANVGVAFGGTILANVLGVSDRMVRAVLRGEKPGANLLGAARQLATSGRVTEAPARRSQRVRAPGGGTIPRAEASGEQVRHSFEAGNRAQTAVQAPSRGLGRERARHAILRDLETHKGGKRGREGVQRVSFTLTLKDGSKITLGSKGGYDPRVAARRIKDDAADPFRWLYDEAAATGTYGETISGASDIVGVVMTYF